MTKKIKFGHSVGHYAFYASLLFYATSKIIDIFYPGTIMVIFGWMLVWFIFFCMYYDRDIVRYFNIFNSEHCKKTKIWVRNSKIFIIISFLICAVITLKNDLTI